MHSLETWEQTAVFDPANPYQKKIEKYAGIPGQYATFYFNPVKTTSTLKGAALGDFTDGFGTGVGILVGVAVVGGLGAWLARKTGLLKKHHSGKTGVAGLGTIGGYKHRSRRRR